MSDTTRSGSRMTFKIACTGSNPMTGTGDFTFGANGYTGQIRIKGKMEGQDVDMTQAIDARRVGGCTARANDGTRRQVFRQNSVTTVLYY